MGRDNEVVPDSQDEAELGDFELQIDRDITPPPARLPSTTPSLSTSPSFILPRQYPNNFRPPGATFTTISQYTSDSNELEISSATSQHTAPLALDTGPQRPQQFSNISEFPLSVAPAKRRPRPRPTFTSAKATNVVTFSDDCSIIHSFPTEEASHISVVSPSFQETYAADISERIKARRAGIQSQASTQKHGTENGEAAKSLKKALHKPVERAAEVIEIISEDEIMLVSPQSPIIKMSGSVVADSSSLKRKRDTLKYDGHESSLSPVPELPPKPKMKKVKGDITNADAPAGKPKKTHKDTEFGLKKPRVKVKGKEKEGEPEQFKSREFILDSDDELTLGNGDGSKPPLVLEASLVNSNRLDVSQYDSVPPMPPAAVSNSPDIAKPADANKATNLLTSEEPKKKASNKKRKTREEGSKENDVSGSASVSKKVKSNKTPKTKPETKSLTMDLATPPSKLVEKINAEVRLSGIISDVESVSKKIKRKKARKVVIDDEDEDEFYEAGEASAPISLPSNTAEKPTPTEQISINSEVEEHAPKAPKKKARKALVEEDNEDVEEVRKESIKPTNEAIHTITPSRTAIPQKPQTLTKDIYPHPPKNRPLYAILQQLNASSPRPRASPAVSRSLLTRIAPLHPNRRAPPPPPPPRIIPKKTKKELEREEKWEEELQETIPGWCDLEEGEREKMRRAKRDWELGLCEE